MPVTITLNSDRQPSRTFNFGVVRDFTFTPLLTYLSVANVLTSYERGAGPASFTIRGSASIRSEGDLVFEDIFSGDQPAGGLFGIHYGNTQAPQVEHLMRGLLGRIRERQLQLE